MRMQGDGACYEDSDYAVYVVGLRLGKGERGWRGVAKGRGWNLRLHEGRLR